MASIRQLLAVPAAIFSTTISSKSNNSAALAVGDGVGETVEAAPPVAVGVGVPAWLVPVDPAVAVKVAGVPVTEEVTVTVARPGVGLVAVMLGLGVADGVIGAVALVVTVAPEVGVAVVAGLGKASSLAPALSCSIAVVADGLIIAKDVASATN